MAVNDAEDYDYKKIAEELMEYLSKKELEPRPHYRILRAILESVEDEDEEMLKIWETGAERHEIGYTFSDLNKNNKKYVTIFEGYLRTGLQDFSPLRIEIEKRVNTPLTTKVFRNHTLCNDYEIKESDDDRLYMKIPIEIKSKKTSKDSQVEFIELEIIKKVHVSSTENRILLKIRNHTTSKKIGQVKKFEFGHILEFKVFEEADNEMYIPIGSFRGYSLLPVIEKDDLKRSQEQGQSCSKDIFNNIYIVKRQLKLRDYFISEIEIPRIKPAGIKAMTISKNLEHNVEVPLHELVQKYIEEKIERKGSTLYGFQVRSIEEILKQLNGSRKPVLITARTAAGKTEAFIIPIINYILLQKEKDPEKKGVRAILMYPTKALANDQLQRIVDIISYINSHIEYKKQISIGVYHGDIEEKLAFDVPMPLKCIECSENESIEKPPRLTVKEGRLICPNCEKDYSFVLIDREKIYQSPPDILIATPDIINYSMAFDKSRHTLFYSPDGVTPEIVVLDELHLFYSIFGKNVSLMLKRLEALIRYYTTYAKKIQYIGASATIRNPQNFGKSFFESNDVVHITTREDEYDFGNPIRKTLIFAMPLAYRMVDTAAYSLITLLQLVDPNVQFKTLVFVNTLNTCDMIKSSLSRRASAFPGLRNLVEKIGIHNSTCTRQERAEIEEKFNTGIYRVLVATSTLEVGVDFKDIDLLMLYSVPYSFNSYLQRIGRAGRHRGAIVYILLNPANPIDVTYYRDALKIVLNPDVFIEYPPFPKHNIVLQRKHVIAAISDFCTASEIDANSVLRDEVDKNIWTALVNHIKSTGLLSSSEDLKRIINEIYAEVGIYDINNENINLFEKIKEILRIGDLRTAENVVDVCLDVYDPKYLETLKDRDYRKIGLSKSDIRLLREIKKRER